MNFSKWPENIKDCFHVALVELLALRLLKECNVSIVLQYKSLIKTLGLFLTVYSFQIFSYVTYHILYFLNGFFLLIFLIIYNVSVLSYYYSLHTLHIHTHNLLYNILKFLRNLKASPSTTTGSSYRNYTTASAPEQRQIMMAFTLETQKNRAGLLLLLYK